MKITKIYIYPIKSLGGIELSTAEVETAGFKHDRRWMLTDHSGHFLTQRKISSMALLKVALMPDCLQVYHLKHPEQTLEIPFSASNGTIQQVKIWEDVVPALSVSKAADDWFSEMLDMNCRLVKLDPAHNRMLKEKYRENNEHVSFADSMPYLIIGQPSLDDLNSKLNKKVEMVRFRPNLVFSGGKAFQEDEWKNIRIGEVDFKVTKPCARCIMTTIDPMTGIKGKEPLLTLSRYRKTGNKVMFGQNLLALNKGFINIGDEISPKIVIRFLNS